MKASRGGTTLKTGKIGRVNCLRQQYVMPGEQMNISMNGSVRLETLRERDVLKINAHLGIFYTPMRWLVPNWDTYIKGGFDSGIVIGSSSEDDFSKLGIGSYNTVPAQACAQFWEDSYLRCVNEWYKHPENADWVAGDVGEHGVPAVPLSKTWSRLRSSTTPEDSDDYQIDVSGATMDVRELAEVQARFRGAMKRDVLAYQRWMELIREVWGGDPSREVDQVPLMLDQAQIGVSPREMPASDGASLGQWQSMYDFNINHQVDGFTAPEHGVITYLLTVRFPSTVESISPFARTTGTKTWFDWVGDPEYLKSAQPVDVQDHDLFQVATFTTLGKLPAGWQWRADHDVIGKSVDVRDSFPYMLVPTTFDQTKDATRVKNAFRSQALDDYLVDLTFSEKSRLPIGDSMDSYFSGMLEHTNPRQGKSGDEFPKGGKSL